jgi:hypothetical protein
MAHRFINVVQSSFRITVLFIFLLLPLIDINANPPSNRASRFDNTIRERDPALCEGTIISAVCIHENLNSNPIFQAASRLTRLRGGGRAWIRKTIQKEQKKERQRKKRNIDNTNLVASVSIFWMLLNPHVSDF